MHVEFSQLKFSYPGSPFGLDIPHLKLDSGSHVALIGPSGSGKSTLLKLIAGILLPLRGEIQAGDRVVNHLSDQHRRDFRIQNIGFVFQDFELLDYLNVLENVLLPCRISRTLRLNPPVVDRAKSLCAAAELSDKLQRPVRRLSQGERQRVAICRALLTQPKIVLADEPTGNLDPASKQHVLDLLLEQTRRSESMLIMVTHDHGLLNKFEKVLDIHHLTRTA